MTFNTSGGNLEKEVHRLHKGKIPLMSWVVHALKEQTAIF